MQNLKRLLTSVGMAMFVRYYNDFKNCTNNKELAEKIMKEQNYRSFDAQLTRVRSARAIFDAHAENDALGIIICSKKLDQTVVEEAKKLKHILDLQYNSPSFPSFSPEEFARELGIK